MARIEFKDIAHSYAADPVDERAYALRRMNFTWDDGGAYALLGPSGCGKTTLLNICSGLLHPSEGRVLFDGQDVTEMQPERRNVAQVFQFPVLYNTMTVFGNLAFPLRNRGVAKAEIKRRVNEVSDMLGLSDVLHRRASNLGAELKQKISMGRGLVREDTSAVLFDEPLTMIDPQEKWKLRRQLKEIHKQFGLTLIYVTHDQTEALTFADRVVVMSEGDIVQVGTPQELFEQPEHTFVGYFIGSPGMNFLPCHIDGSDAVVEGQRIALPSGLADLAKGHDDGTLKLGIRPEFVELADGSHGMTLRLEQVAEMGQFRLVTAALADHSIKLKVPQNRGPVEGPEISVEFPPHRVCLYAHERLLHGPREAAYG